MKRLVFVLFALVALSSPAAALDPTAPTAAAPALPVAVLNKPYVSTLGDMIAFSMSQYAQVQRSREGWGGINATVAASYDHDANKIVLSLYGDVGSTPVDQARTTLDAFRTRFLPVLAWAVANQYHVGIAENDVTLVFCNRATMKEVLRREEQKYLVAD